MGSGAPDRAGLVVHRPAALDGSLPKPLESVRLVILTRQSAPGLMLLKQSFCGFTGCGNGNTGAALAELARFSTASRLPTVLEVSRAARGWTLNTDSIILSTEV